MDDWRDAFPADFDPKVLEGLDPEMFSNPAKMQEWNDKMTGANAFEPNMALMDYLTCPVCQTMMKHSYSAVEKLRSKYKTKRVSEVEIDELLEDFCDPLEEIGSWILEYEIVEKEDEDNGK